MKEIGRYIDKYIDRERERERDGDGAILVHPFRTTLDHAEYVCSVSVRTHSAIHKHVLAALSRHVCSWCGRGYESQTLH